MRGYGPGFERVLGSSHEVSEEGVWEGSSTGDGDSGSPKCKGTKGPVSQPENVIRGRVSRDRPRSRSRFSFVGFTPETRGPRLVGSETYG